MASHTYLHAQDAVIEREGEGELKIANLYDCDGELRYHFPASWTDDQIMYAIGFANRAYSQGVAHGEWSKAAHVRAVLGITDQGGQQ